MYLVEDLIAVYIAYHNSEELVANQGQAMDGYSALANYDDLVRQLKEEMENL